MALRGDREIYIGDISKVCKNTGEAGKLVIIQSPQDAGHGSGSGYNKDGATVVVCPTGTPASGSVIAGVLLQDVVDKDETITHRNFHNGEALIGENVWLGKDCMVWTDAISGSPVPGDKAYLGASGVFRPTQLGDIESCGRFQTAKDGDGYAKVYVKVA